MKSAHNVWCIRGVQLSRSLTKYRIFTSEKCTFYCIKKAKIHEETNWRFLLPIILMEEHTAILENNEVEYEFTLQDPNELFRRKGKEDVYENYFPKGPLLTPWSKAIKDEDFQFLVIDGIPASEWTEYKVSQNYYWAMGDNRDNSLDSRYWGYIPENNILGEALFTYFSLDLDSWTPRWDRIGTVLR